ncbi:MAG: ribonuclease P protein component [Bacteroidota bacterium]|nr:ribonuclease P protein component [Bacteroidota bacterium]
MQRAAGNSLSVTNRSIDNTPRHRLSKSEILRGYRAFGRVLSRGRYVQSGNVRCYFDIKREIPPYQCTVGFAVRKARSSVQRNRVRRLLRESFRQRQSDLRFLCQQQKITLRCVFLLNAQKTGRHLAFAEVDEAMRNILNGVEEKLQAA